MGHTNMFKPKSYTEMNKNKYIKMFVLYTRKGKNGNLSVSALDDNMIKV